MIDSSQPGTYRVVTFHAVTASSSAAAEEQIGQAYPELAVIDEGTALIATSDGADVEAPEVCGHEHVGTPVLYYDGAFKTEVLVR